MLPLAGLVDRFGVARLQTLCQFAQPLRRACHRFIAGVLRQRFTVNGHTRRVYKDGSGKLLLETYTIEGLPHATPVDPGNKPTQCGEVEPFIVDANICSSYHILRFWGLDQQ